jgi:endo-beta-N-acetylglucosaminidase D
MPSPNLLTGVGDITEGGRMNRYTSSWREVLRPIRDGFRHYFPEKPVPDDSEERKKKQESDALKGYAYLDTFAQLKSWIPEDNDPLQRANIPLIQRSTLPEVPGGHSGARLLLCHDFNGGYHDYESADPRGVVEENFAFEYLQYIETFVYFSHRLVTIPPATWTNTLHRNGVKSLGTFIVEPQTPGLENILKFETIGTNGKKVFPVARRLVAISRFFGFDGWLINIEKTFSKNEWDLELLLEFLRNLKEQLNSQEQLVWCV